MALQKFKKTSALFINNLLREHAKLTLIILLTLATLFCLLFYINPPAEKTDHAPIQFLPKRINNWQGEPARVGIVFKNNNYNTSTYTDHQTKTSIQFVSYQRRNEKDNQIHYPEDCLRSIGIFKFETSIIPIKLGTRTVYFKKLLALQGDQTLLQYYTIFTKHGDNFLYTTDENLNIRALLSRKFSAKRSLDQIFRFSVQTEPTKAKQAEKEIIKLIQEFPEEFWPK